MGFIVGKYFFLFFNVLLSVIWKVIGSVISRRGRKVIVVMVVFIREVFFVIEVLRVMDGVIWVIKVVCFL